MIIDETIQKRQTILEDTNDQEMQIEKIQKKTETLNTQLKY